MLGRETALQPVRWTADGWIEPSEPLVQVGAPANVPVVGSQSYSFDGELPADFQWLRTPYPEALFSLTARPGHLTLFGCETIGSLFEQSLVGRRQTSFCYEATTSVDFEPESFQQSAGLVCYYNSTKFHYAYISFDETAGRHLRVMSALPYPSCPEALSKIYPLAAGPVELRVLSDGRQLRFSYRTDGAWQELDEVFDATSLSDEATLPGHPSFTGTFIAMACQDMSGRACPAHFAGFAYTHLEAATEAESVPRRRGVA